MDKLIYKTQEECVNLPISNTQFAYDSCWGGRYDDQQQHRGIAIFDGVYLQSLTALSKAVMRRGYAAEVRLEEAHGNPDGVPDQWSETRCYPIYLLSGESYVCTGLHNRGVTEGYYEFMPLEEWLHIWDDLEDS